MRGVMLPMGRAVIRFESPVGQTEESGRPGWLMEGWAVVGVRAIDRETVIARLPAAESCAREEAGQVTGGEGDCAQVSALIANPGTVAIVVRNDEGREETVYTLIDPTTLAPDAGTWLVTTAPDVLAGFDPVIVGGADPVTFWASARGREIPVPPPPPPRRRRWPWVVGSAAGGVALTGLTLWAVR